MGQVRWAGWTMAIATALVISGAQARADVASDRPAAILVYPKIVVDTANGIDTVIRLTNTNLNQNSDPSKQTVNVHCFYIDANSHCTNNPSIICADSTDCCSGTSCGTCVPSCVETDFYIVLTQGQPIFWKASEGLAGEDLPLPFGVCSGNPFIHCGSDYVCSQYGWGTCSANNSETRIPPVAEDRFQGELKCIETNAEHQPVASNDLKGEAILERSTASDLDVASYNAIGIQAATPNGLPISNNPLQLGGNTPDYNGCPNILILDNFFDQALDPVSGDQIHTDLTLVACSEDLLRQVSKTTTVQYLVYNEFEQRLSTSRPVTCFQENDWLCNIDTTQCVRSIFAVGIQGTLTGQTIISPVDNPDPDMPQMHDGLLGVAIESHGEATRTAAFNLHFRGQRMNSAGDLVPDTITLP